MLMVALSGEAFAVNSASVRLPSKKATVPPEEQKAGLMKLVNQLSKDELMKQRAKQQAPTKKEEEESQMISKQIDLEKIKALTSLMEAKKLLSSQNRSIRLLEIEVGYLKGQKADSEAEMEELLQSTTDIVDGVKREYRNLQNAFKSLMFAKDKSEASVVLNDLKKSYLSSKEVQELQNLHDKNEAVFFHYAENFEGLMDTSLNYTEDDEQAWLKAMKEGDDKKKEARQKRLQGIKDGQAGLVDPGADQSHIAPATGNSHLGPVTGEDINNAKNRVLDVLRGEVATVGEHVQVEIAKGISGIENVQYATTDDLDQAAQDLLRLVDEDANRQINGVNTVLTEIQPILNSKKTPSNAVYQGIITAYNELSPKFNVALEDVSATDNNKMVNLANIAEVLKGRLNALRQFSEQAPKIKGDIENARQIQVQEDPERQVQ